jgi:hypothetical protein
VFLEDKTRSAPARMLNLDTGVPMIYQLNADSTVGEKRDLVG